MQPPAKDTPIERALNRSELALGALRKFFAGYFWLILKNVLGWMLVLLALPVGLTVPGPAGVPLFLIGFALVFFPGKRRLTTHILRGRPLRLEASIFTAITTIASLIVMTAILWIAGAKSKQVMAHFNLDPDKSASGYIAAVAGICILGAIVTWGTMWLSLRFVNVLIRFVPRMRRVMRRFMRRMGFRLLPPPKKAGLRQQAEIIEMSEGSKRRFSRIWQFLKPWIRRIGGIGITVALFWYLIKPIVLHWAEVSTLAEKISPLNFVLAVGLFAVFLFVFRTISWWTILRGLGHPVPLAPTTRIWSTSELARYLPGVIWQVVGRIYLVKPYGVPGAICSTSQVLELIVFLLANVFVAVACLLWFGIKNVHDTARIWLVVAMCLLPGLLILLHPSVFYRIMNKVISAFKRPPVATRVPGWTLMALLAWNIVGLVVMGIAIWLIVTGPLGLPIGKWWVVGGAYCLAWCAGFIAVWAPGGIGVREWVFMLVVIVILPEAIQAKYPHEALKDFARLVALILRGWATAGELVVAIFAYLFDLPGALATFKGRRPQARLTAHPSPSGGA